MTVTERTCNSVLQSEFRVQVIAFLFHYVTAQQNALVLPPGRDRVLRKHNSPPFTNHYCSTWYRDKRPHNSHQQEHVILGLAWLQVALILTILPLVQAMPLAMEALLTCTNGFLLKCTGPTATCYCLLQLPLVMPKFPVRFLSQDPFVSPEKC